MNRFRHLFAVFLAILIASPVCCCAGMVREKEKPAHSCCGSSKKEKKEEACACGTKTPRVSEKHSIPTDVPVLAMPEPVEMDIPVLVRALVSVEMSALPRVVDTGPQRRRLAILQRFLI